MNYDQLSVALSTLVESAVRPVVAMQRTKRDMREELLAHVTAVYDEEFRRLGDSTESLRATRQRFGDTRELTCSLQASVPWWNRRLSMLDKFTPQPGESLARQVVKHALVGFGCFALVLLLFELVPARGLKGVEFAMKLRLCLAMGLFTSVQSITFFVLADRTGRCLYDDSNELELRPGGLRRAAGWLLAGALALPLGAFAVYWLLTFDIAGALGHLRFALLFAPLGPPLFVVMARQMTRDRCYLEHWAALDVES